VTSTSSSTSATATSSLVTALGGGSGIDMAALANNLATAQFAARTDRLAAKSDKLDAQISAASNVKSMLLALDTSLGTLVRSGDLAPKPSIANAAVASATLSGTVTPSGAFSLEVTQLATGQRLASGAFPAPASTVGAGTLTLKFGTVTAAATSSGGTTPGSFAEDTAKAQVDIAIPPGATLADVATRINAAGAGVTAYVAQTVDGAQLVLKGAEGARNGFVLEAAEDAAHPGLSALAWSPTAGTGTLLASVGDAAFKVDGLAMAAPSNTVSDAIPGVKLSLAATNAGAPTTVSFADPGTSMQSSLRDLTDALNEVMAELNKDTAIGGNLANDAGARALKRSLSALAGTTIMPNAAGAAKTLADLGLKTQRDGTFTLDTARLATTLAADPQGVAAMFTNGVHGVFASVDKIYRVATSATDTNSLGGSISRYTKAKTQVATDKTGLADQQEKLRAQLAARFTTSETRIGQSKSTLTMIQNQIAQWNKSS